MAESGGESKPRAPEVAHLVPAYTRGRGLDLGCGDHKLYPHWIGLDRRATRSPYTENDAGNLIGDATDLSLFADRALDFVFSSHLLQDLDDPAAALDEWWRVLKPGGHLVLWETDKMTYLADRHITANMPSWVQVESCIRDTKNRGFKATFTVFRKTKDFVQERKPWKKPDKACLVIRYGGFGDMIFVSSVLPELKKQGWHVTFNTTTRGYDVIREDPHIDDFIVYDDQQIPNRNLGALWWGFRERYDRVINFSEAIECQLLAVPGRISHQYPHDVRRAMFGRVNYVERHHEIAGVPFEPQPRFHPTQAERLWAKKLKKKLSKDGKRPVIQWVLSGSSVHKTWPWLDRVIASLMLETEAVVVLCGDPMSKMLEIGWENEPRVIKASGEWELRQTLTFIERADLVIGPETGVLNAAAMLETPKIAVLSHSTHENWTRDWVNTIAFESRGCSESPCLRMHYNFDFCHRDAGTGTAKCAASLSADEVHGAILEVLDGRARYGPRGARQLSVAAE